MEDDIKNNKVKIIVIIVIILLTTGGISALKKYNSQSSSEHNVVKIESTDGLPVLVDLGSTTCIPCKKMAPILEEVKKEYAGKVNVQVIDVNSDGEKAQKYKIKLIPTQILFDAKGNEVMRHEGFIPKEEILKSFEKVGIK